VFYDRLHGLLLLLGFLFVWMECLFLKVSPSLRRRLQRADWLMGNLNSSISSWRVMSGCSRTFSTTLAMVVVSTRGFRPQFSGSGS
jgi:hypothetical protein